MTVGVGSYGVASAAFFVLLALVLAGRISRHWAIVGLIAATVLWSAFGCWMVQGGGEGRSLYDLLDFARSAALLLLVHDALQRLSNVDHRDRRPMRAGLFLPMIATVTLTLGVLGLVEVENAVFFGLIGHVAFAVIGLFLIENLFQASRPNELWSTKHLLIGAGTIFAFDLFFYTDALLFLQINDTIRSAQPIIAVLAIPLILISARRLSKVLIHLPVSRGLLVSTTALLASGIYILCVAAIAYLIRGLGWEWGPTLQLIFLIGAAMVLLILFSSTSLRHGGRRFIERNLFTFAFDYRREWLRLVSSMASAADELPLGQRALKASAAVMDADGGALFLRSDDGDLHCSSTWNIATDRKTPGAPPPGILRALSAEHTAIVFGQAETMPPDLLDDVEVQDWLSDFRDPWIAVALLAQHELVGLIMITRPRMRRRLTWEDLDLLEIFSHQLGSYLTVEQLARHVAEAEHFDRMSKHVTFVAHDLKNLISQLSLVLQQAKRHAHDPAFVSDSFLTIGDAVEKMKVLMHRVQEGAHAPALAPVDLSALVKDIEKRGRCDRLETFAESMIVAAEPTVLEALLGHVIDNARDACPEGGQVTLALRQEGSQACLEVRDDGPGMTRAFIETELFKPFASTKSSGFGIGMYQCRDCIRRWQGSLLVDSEPGQGTTIKMMLPLAVSRSDEGEATAAHHERANLGAGRSMLPVGDRAA